MRRTVRWVVLVGAAALAAAVALSYALAPDAGHVSSTASDLDTTGTAGPEDPAPLVRDGR